MFSFFRLSVIPGPPLGSRETITGPPINSGPPRVHHLPVLLRGKGEKKAVLPTSCQHGFLLSFSPLEYGKIGKSGGAGIDWVGSRLPRHLPVLNLTENLAEKSPSDFSDSPVRKESN